MNDYSIIRTYILMQPTKRRIPKGNAPPVEITKTRQFNNGNIDIIHPETSSTVQNLRVPVDEVLINGRRYRVPEKVIMLDFWNKLNKADPEEKRSCFHTETFTHPLMHLHQRDGIIFCHVVPVDISQLARGLQ